MGIIGVVAALTLPNLNSSTGDKEKVTKLQKTYASLEDAYGRALAVYGPVTTWFSNDTCSNGGGNTVTNNACAKRFGDRLTEFMRVSKNCGVLRSGGECFANTDVKFLNNTKAQNPMDTFSCYKFITADNVSMCINFWTKNFTSDANGTVGNAGADIHIDLDGPNKGANTYGKDFFQFIVTQDAIIPHGRNHCEDVFTKGLCAADWIIEYGNMDYLKCPSELSWETKTSCK
ncbi:hypothetical protein IJ843_03255 [bacterium]|nr:hypothetical protein [bacterium]